MTDEKHYHKEPTGLAAETAKAHGAEHELKLFGGCFCPFVHRVWISLEYKGLPYQYIEIDPYAKPKELMEINHRGLVPALKDGDWGCYESTVLLEYLEDKDDKRPLLPKDPKDRAYQRVWCDHINRHVIPSFYRYLQAQEPEKQIQFAKEYNETIAKLVYAANPNTKFFASDEVGYVDVMLAPWVVRGSRVLKPYRGWQEPDPNSRTGKWFAAIEEVDAVKKTTSTDQLYLDSYERYAQNRPGTSQVSKAINEGKGLP